MLKKRFFYLLAFFLLLAGVLGPALYMHKVSPSQLEGVKAGGVAGEKASATVQTEGNGVTGEEVSATVQTESKGPGSPATPSQPTSGPSAPLSGPAPAQAGTPEDRSGAKQTAGEAQTNTGGTAEKAGVSGGQATGEEGVRVWIAVVGQNGELLFPPSQVTVKKDHNWGVTALGALDATGLPYTTKPTWPDFVESIGGQANYQMSGWMYSVNGEVPMHMASKHPVKAGDKVIWWYSTSMDKPAPRWEDLIARR